MKMIISVFTKERRYNKIKKNKKLIILSIIIICIIIVDQIVKVIITKEIYNSSIVAINGVLNFTYTENRGRSIWNRK